MVIIIMGVTGCGKTSLGLSLAKALDAQFIDADDHHPPANRKKLQSGIPLCDSDRMPWLKILADLLHEKSKSGDVVLACSALKQSYRDILQTSGQPTLFVHLKLDRETILRRMKDRAGKHELVRDDFQSIIDGQYKDLEPPRDALEFCTEVPTERMADEIIPSLPLHKERIGREYFAEGDANTDIQENRAEELLNGMLSEVGNLKRVLLIPPDFTRFHSWSGPLTAMLYRMLSPSKEVHVLPALGTHVPMTREQRHLMFPGVPDDAFRIHNWRKDLVRLGEIPAEELQHLSGGKVDFPIPCEVNELLLKGGYDRIFSIGQLVPHEVIGIANHNKNVFVGTGGRDSINRTHYLGAVCGMESIMGRMRTPVREVLIRMSERFSNLLPPITYILTVRGNNAEGELVTRGLFCGDGFGCYYRGAALSQQVNLTLLDKPIEKCVVYLDPEEFHSTWLGNKAIYRTRCAMAQGGELVIIAPGVSMFGEDPGIDSLIRRFGYHGTGRTLEAVDSQPELGESLAAAAHLIHGSSEDRFRIFYAPGGLTKSEVEEVGYGYMDPQQAADRYPMNKLKDGWNHMGGEEVFFISNPALGLWALKETFPSL